MPLSLPALDNLVRIGQLKAEPRNEAEIKRMLEMARTRLADAQLDSLSREGRFTSAYNAAHETVAIRPLSRHPAQFMSFLGRCMVQVLCADRSVSMSEMCWWSW